MSIKQLSIFVENKFGKLAAILEILAKGNYNMSALSVADTTDFGIVRIIVDRPEEAKKTLRENGVIVKVTDVIAVDIEERPGGLSEIMNILRDGGISVEYMYAFFPKMRGSAMVVLRVDKPDEAQTLFADKGIRTASEDDVR